jgi:predicted Zn-dependent protease
MFSLGDTNTDIAYELDKLNQDCSRVSMFDSEGKKRIYQDKYDADLKTYKAQDVLDYIQKYEKRGMVLGTIAVDLLVAIFHSTINLRHEDWYNWEELYVVFYRY